jgi:hypothetical protein
MSNRALVPTQRKKINVRITVVASMRNEGPFIVEWVAWYLMLGFTDIVVVTNNCTDHSPQLLDQLQQQGVLHHLRCDVPEGQPITQRKLDFAKGHKSVRRADWVLVCDVDEFLVIHKGAGQIGDLLNLNGDDPEYLGMSINWKAFGTGGVKHFVDAPVHQQFLYACPADHVLSIATKAIFRLPKRFAQLGEHGPRGLEFARFGVPWGSKGFRWVNSAGVDVESWTPKGRYLRNLPRDLVTHQVAQMNHYMLRSNETYSLKKGTLSPVKLANRYTPNYFARANSRKESELSALRYLEQFSEKFATLMGLAGVARLHALCCADHLRLIAQKAGRPIADDPRYQAFLDQAENPRLMI